jgi:hypothetical protein
MSDFAHSIMRMEQMESDYQDMEAEKHYVAMVGQSVAQSPAPDDEPDIEEFSVPVPGDPDYDA